MFAHSRPSLPHGSVPPAVRTTTTTVVSAFRRLVLSVLIAGLCLIGTWAVAGVQPAAADVVVEAYDSEIRVNRDGTLRVTETWKVGEGSGALRRGILTRRHYPDDIDHVIEITDVAAKVDGRSVSPELVTEEDVTTLGVDGLDGARTVRLSYRVRGAVVPAQGGGAELLWAPLHGTPRIAKATITLNSPQPTYIRCSAGPLGAERPCSLSQITESWPVFQQNDLANGHAMTIVAGFPEGEVEPAALVEYRRSIRRAFLADPLRLGVAAGVLVLGGIGLLVLHRVRGRDPIDPTRVVPASLFARHNGTVVFAPPQDLRPGEIGTLIDERVDPVDITSTILDLAVRGHLRITELPRRSGYARADWVLTRASAAPDALQTYEVKLLDAIFEGDQEVRVSQIGPRVRENLDAVQEALYDEVVAHGWFAERPDRTRTKWSTLGIVTLVVGVGLTVALALFSTWGLLGLAVTTLGVGLFVLGGHMPVKAPAAGRVIGQVASLRGELLELDPQHLPPDRHVELCARALPYAIVLGGADRWIDALVATDTDDTPDEGFAWYRGPAGWHLQDLPDSLKNFSVSLTGALFSR